MPSAACSDECEATKKAACENSHAAFHSVIGCQSSPTQPAVISPIRTVRYC